MSMMLDVRGFDDTKGSCDRGAGELASARPARPEYPLPAISF